MLMLYTSPTQKSNVRGFFIIPILTMLLCLMCIIRCSVFWISYAQEYQIDKQKYFQYHAIAHVIMNEAIHSVSVHHKRIQDNQRHVFLLTYPEIVYSGSVQGYWGRAEIVSDSYDIITVKVSIGVISNDDILYQMATELKKTIIDKGGSSYVHTYTLVS